MERVDSDSVSWLLVNVERVDSERAAGCYLPVERVDLEGVDRLLLTCGKG